MSTADFNEKLRAHRAHMAAVPGAMTSLRNALIDINGRPMADGDEAGGGLTCGELRTVLAEVDRLQAQVAQLQKDMREEQREFQREARDIAAEAAQIDTSVPAWPFPNTPAAKKAGGKRATAA